MANEAKAKPAGKKVYEIHKRSTDNLWTVKIKGSDKVIKTFKTKVEAEDYTHSMAGNQEAAVLVRNSKGANKGKYSASSKSSADIAKKKQEKEAKKAAEEAKKAKAGKGKK